MINRVCRRTIVENWRARLVCVGSPSADGCSVGGAAGGGPLSARYRSLAPCGSAATVLKMSAQLVVPIAAPIALGGPQNAVLPPGASSST